MTEKEKAKAYDEALEKAKQIIVEYDYDEHNNVFMEIFPELKESEDEKIRKVIIGLLKQSTYEDCDYDGVNMKDIYAWLEKQDEPTDINPSEFDLRLNKLLKQFESLPKEELANSLSFYLNVVQNNGTYKPDEKQGEQKPYGQRKECLDCQFNYAGECKGSCQMKRDEQKPIIEMKSAEESLGISSEEYNDIVNECLYGESEYSDKVELKFKVGDWITNGDYTWKIIEVKPLDYILQSQDGNIVDDTISHVDEQFHSFTIKDAKDGDVLVCKGDIKNSNGIKYERICLFKNLDNAFFTLTKTSNYEEYAIDVNIDYPDNTVPATKGQKEILFMAMKGAGYSFDFEKKELKKVEQNMELTDFESALFTAFSDAWQQYLIGEEVNVAQWAKEHSAELLEEARKEHIEWSEEDEKMVKDIIAAIDTLYYHGMVNWLKSLKDRVIPQPKQEWSEEDKEFINDLIGVFDGQQYQAHSDEEIVKWLKSIRLPYNKEWNENDEEMLKSIIATCELACEDRDSSPARHLLQMQTDWLKSLKQRHTWKPSEE